MNSWMSTKKLIAILGTLAVSFSVMAEETGPCNPGDFLRKVVTEPELRLNFQPHELELHKLDRNLVKSVQAGDDYTYFVDTLNQVHFVKGNHLFDETGDFFAIKNIGGKEPFVVKESGFFKFDKDNKAFLFESKRGWDLAPNEADEYLNMVAKNDPDVKFTRKVNPTMEKTQVVKCLDVLASRNKGKNFIMDTIVSSNVVSLAGVVTNEIAGNHLLSTEKGRRLVAADFIANNISSLITGPIVKNAIVKDIPVLKDLAIRTAADFGTNRYIKKNLYDYLSKEKPDPKKESLGDRLVPYDTGFGVMRFFPKRALDKALVYQIPRLMIDSCLKGSKLTAIVGPRMIRIADRYTWGLVYLSGRKVYLNATEDSGDKPDGAAPGSTGPGTKASKKPTW
jgi:hypothetical protein